MHDDVPTQEAQGVEHTRLDLNRQAGRTSDACRSRSGLSRRARVIIRQNLYLSLAVIAALILAITTGIFGLTPAVRIHEGSTLLAIGNALRLLVHEG